MLREAARAIGISATIVFTMVAVFMWISSNPRAYGRFTTELGKWIFSLPIGWIGVALAIVVNLILIVGVPLTIYEKWEKRKARREDGNLGRYDDPDYVEQRD